MNMKENYEVKIENIKFGISSLAHKNIVYIITNLLC